jgi:hypothetical protein
MLLQPLVKCKKRSAEVISGLVDNPRLTSALFPQQRTSSDPQNEQMLHDDTSLHRRRLSSSLLCEARRMRGLRG